MGAELCVADLVNASQTVPGILHAARAPVTDGRHVPSDPRSGLVKIHLRLRHEWLSSSTDPLCLCGMPGGLSVPAWPPGALERKQFSLCLTHIHTPFRFITSHCCHTTLLLITLHWFETFPHCFSPESLSEFIGV